MDELERFKRHINFVDFASSRGYELDRKESSRSSVVLRNPSTDDKLVVRRDTDEHWTYFSVRDDSDRGSVIDFVQRRGCTNLGEARKELRSWLGLERPPAPLHRRAPVDLPPQVRDRPGILEAFRETREVRNSLYLNSRGIRVETLNDPRFRGAWRIDRRGNVVFPHYDPEGLSGYEQKNHGFTGFAKGGQRALWRSHDRATDSRVVYVESAIDALSHHQLHPDANTNTRYRSTGGALSAHQRSIIAAELKALAPTVSIVAAFDADEAGAKLGVELAALVRGRAIERETPLGGKDWNAVLQRKERDYIRSLGPPPRSSPSREL